jgi:nucleoid-associated protein YgaU
MVSIDSQWRYIWVFLGVIISLSVLFAGCAKTPKPPTPTAAEVSQRLIALNDCITRTQGVVDASMKAGVSAGAMAPVNTSLSDAQEALEDAKSLVQQGKLQEASERVNKALEDCNKLEAMAVKARDEALERAGRAKLRAQADGRLSQVAPCIEAARQAITSAEAAGASAQELAAAKQALANSEAAAKEARDLLAQDDPQRALSRLDAAQTDCQTARELGNKAGIAAASRGRPDNYTVVSGDSLWRISGKEIIYKNSLMWPLIYKANRDKIRDPDLIYPKQVFAIPRHYAQEEANTAVRRARTRGPWRIGDGPDNYILEGVRR